MASYTGIVTDTNGQSVVFECKNKKEIADKVCEMVESLFGKVEFPHGCVCDEDGNVWTITLDEQGRARGIQRY